MACSATSKRFAQTPRVSSARVPSCKILTDSAIGSAVPFGDWSLTIEDWNPAEAGVVGNGSSATIKTEVCRLSHCYVIITDPSFSHSSLPSRSPPSLPGTSSCPPLPTSPESVATPPPSSSQPPFDLFSSSLEIFHTDLSASASTATTSPSISSADLPPSPRPLSKKAGTRSSSRWQLRST